MRIELMEAVLRSLQVSHRPSFTNDDIYEIDPAGPDTLVGLGVLRSGERLTCVRCDQCPEECIIDVKHELDSTGDVRMAFGFCPEPGEGSRLIKIDPVRLKTWQADAPTLAQQVCRWLGLDAFPATIAPGHAWRLGVFDAGRSSHKVFLAVGLGCDNVSASALGALDASLKDALAPILFVPCDGGSQLPFHLPEEAEVMSLVSLLRPTQEGFGLCLDTLTRRLSARRGDDNVLPVPPGYQFFSGYRQVSRLGVDYDLLPRHAEIIKKLHESWAAGNPRVRHTDLLRGLPKHTRMRDAFRSRLSAYNDLLKHDNYGYYELNIPKPV